MEEGLPSKEKNENIQLVFKQKIMDSRWQDYNFPYQLKISFKNKNWRLTFRIEMLKTWQNVSPVKQPCNC